MYATFEWVVKMTPLYMSTNQIIRIYSNVLKLVVFTDRTTRMQTLPKTERPWWRKQYTEFYFTMTYYNTACTHEVTIISLIQSSKASVTETT